MFDLLTRFGVTRPAPATFELNGEKYKYFYHRYNKTWLNERAVEVPVIMNIVKKYEPQHVLEVGDVLPHYFGCLHTVIDKYDRSNGAMKADIADVKFLDKFTLIVSISTLEHVGWDEFPRQPLKFILAYQNMKRLLAPGGTLAITIPIGYNPRCDAGFIFSGVLQNMYFMRRVSKDNRWEECSRDDALKAEYNHPYKFANAIMIGIGG